MSDPILPLAVWEEGTLQNDVPANDNALRVEAMRRPVLGIENAPTSTNDGDVFIVGAAPSGDFATFVPDDLTIYRGGNWYAWAPVQGMDINGYVYTGSGGWLSSGGSGAVDSVNGQTGVVVLSLDDLDDVDAPAPTNGDVLTWNSGDSEWQAAAPTGGGMTNPMTTAGDLIIGGVSGAPARLAAGTDAYVLTMVAGSPAWAAGGGGGLTNWTEAYGAGTQATSSFTATNASTNVNAALVAKGTGATTAQIPDGTTAGGNARGTHATDWQKSRNAAAKVASGNYSTIAGGNGNTTSGAYAFAVGDSNTGSGGTSSAIGSGNTASGTYSAAIGYAGSSGGTASLTVNYNCTASGNYSFSGGYFSTSTVEGSFTFGQQCSASGIYSQAVGDNCTSDAAYAQASGRYATSRGVVGASARASHRFAANGDAQRREFVLCSDTTTATPEALTANNAAASATNQVVLPNASAYNFEGKVVVRENATGDCASYKFEGTIRRGANAASTALVAAVTPVVVSADAGAATWAVAVTADTTNGALAITVTGEASHNLKWTGFVETVEVVG